MIQTKQKILDTAERLFGEQGYDATSLRQITGEAGVNLAAIHYHFGSKDELLDEIVKRKVGPINAERLALLDRFQEEAGGAPAPVEKVMEAFLSPAIRFAEDSPAFVKLMGRLYGERLMARIIEKHFKYLAGPFVDAVRRALPDLPDDELAWRGHFMIGAMALTLCRPPESSFYLSKDSPANVAKRLVAFVSAGFRAPVTARKKEEKHEIVIQELNR
jgi:AcrR family transcriptional regulator